MRSYPLIYGRVCNFHGIIGECKIVRVEEWAKNGDSLNDRLSNVCRYCKDVDLSNIATETSFFSSLLVNTLLVDYFHVQYWGPTYERLYLFCSQICKLECCCIYPF